MELEERYRWSGTCVEKKEVRRPRRKRRSSQAFLEEKENGKSSQAFPKKTLRFYKHLALKYSPTISSQNTSYI